MRQVLVVKTESIQLVEGVKLTEEAMEVFNLFKCYAFIAEHTEGGDLSQCLCLEPLTDEVNDKFLKMVDISTVQIILMPMSLWQYSMNYQTLQDQFYSLRMIF